MCSTIQAWQFCYHGNILCSRPTQYLRLYWPPLAFANGTSYVWSSKNIIICKLKFMASLIFSKLKITNILKSGGCGLEKSKLPCEQNFFYISRFISCRTISPPSFNGLWCKLDKIAVLDGYTSYNTSIRLSAWHHQWSCLPILHIFQTQISPELIQIFDNGKLCFYFFIEFYEIHLKNQGVKIWYLLRLFCRMRNRSEQAQIHSLGRSVSQLVGQSILHSLGGTL